MNKILLPCHFNCCLFLNFSLFFIGYFFCNSEVMFIVLLCTSNVCTCKCVCECMFMHIMLVPKMPLYMSLLTRFLCVKYRNGNSCIMQSWNKLFHFIVSYIYIHKSLVFSLIRRMNYLHCININNFSNHKYRNFLIVSLGSPTRLSIR